MNPESRNNPEQDLINELEAETGISRQIMERIKGSARLKRAFEIILLSVGLSLAAVDAGQAQEAEGQVTPDGGIEIKDEKAERIAEAKEKFIGIIKQLQSAGLLELKNIPGHEVVMEGRVGRYDIEVSFHSYKEGDEKLDNNKSKRLTVHYNDENGTDYYLDDFFGDFQSYGINNEPAEGLEKKDKKFFFSKGIVLGGDNTDYAYFKELDPETVEEIIGDIRQQAGLAGE